MSETVNQENDQAIENEVKTFTNAYFVRWWYDQQKETCSSFIYGGCQGNNNNFQSESVCHAICPQRSKSQSPC